MSSAEFLPPTPRALSDDDLQEVIARAKADGSGVLGQMQILEAQAHLRETDKSEYLAWVSHMREIGSDEALLAIQNAERAKLGFEPLESLIGSEEQAATELDEQVALVEKQQPAPYFATLVEPIEDVATAETQVAPVAVVEEVEPIAVSAVIEPPASILPVIETSAASPIVDQPTVAPRAPRPPRVRDESVSQFWAWLPISGSLLPFGIALWLRSIGLSTSQSVAALLLGIFVSAGVIAVGAIAGKRGSLPTIVLSRAAFGVYGNLAPAVLIVLSRLFWAFVIVSLSYLLVAQGLVQQTAIDSGQQPLSALAISLIGVLVIASVVLAAVGGKVLQWAQRVSGQLGLVAAIVIAVIRLPAAKAHIASSGTWLQTLGAGVIIFAIFGMAWSSASADFASKLPVNVRGWKVAGWALISLGVVPSVLGLVGVFIFEPNASVGAQFATMVSGSSDWFNPISLTILLSLVITLVTTSAMSLRSSSLSFESIGLKVRAALVSPIVALVIAAIAIFAVTNWGAAGLWQNIRAFALLFAVPVAAWSGVFVADVLIRRIAYHEVSLSRGYGFYKSVNLANLIGWLVAVVLGLGLVRSSLNGFGWLGYLSDFASNSEFWNESNFGVIIAFAVGLLLPVAFGIPRIKRQEREVLLIEARRNDLKDILGFGD
jgi:nucleobase:cation symporter-1, NCS1 family